jgi:hypothetical protein
LLLPSSLIGQKKFGKLSKGTEAAHVLSFRVVNSIETSTVGRPLGKKARRKLCIELNQDWNLLIKTRKENMRDDAEDKKIVEAYLNATAIQDQSVAARAHQAYQADCMLSNAKYQKALGEITVLNVETGRTHLLKNHT